jgi:hypothetical protein
MATLEALEVKATDAEKRIAALEEAVATGLIISHLKRQMFES